MDPMKRFNQARGIGPLALLRLRAEYLLERVDELGAEGLQQQWSKTKEQLEQLAKKQILAPQRPWREADREELVRIASAPKADDREFLGGFDWILADEDEE